MKWLAPFLLLLLSQVIESPAQVKNKFFQMPAAATPTDYNHSVVLAKLKSSKRGVFSIPKVNGRSAQVFPESIGVRSVNRLINEKLLFRGRTQKGPRTSQSRVDLDLYYEIACHPGKNIEEFINELYSTGYFELVEPDFVYRSQFTPNDPLMGSQYYLGKIKAFAAWDVTQGSESVIIAIVDSGGDLEHADLKDNIYTNPADPVDGVDNDNNGFIDDVNGWDFMGADTLNIGVPNFPGDNNPNILIGGIGHGVSVAGCAGARVNNNIGIAGVGFKSKLLFTKHSADNQNPSKPSIYRGYNGILYAASVGAHVINCSWGGSFRSQIFQDVITFASVDLGAVVVAAAGNDASGEPFYPASYDNVLSVAAVNDQNIKASFTNIGKEVDVSAPGVGIFTTANDDLYTTIQGTSFSSPIVAGAAALVRAKFPGYTSQQVAEQIRVSANRAALYDVNPSFTNLMGFGLLDVERALTITSPSVRASNPRMVNEAGTAAEPGQKALLSFTFKNLLQATSEAIEISITTSSGFVQITKGTVKPGAIPENGSVNTKGGPFEMQLLAGTPENTEASMTITYRDGSYLDQEVVTFVLNPSFIDVDDNLITTTVSGTGRIGFEDSESSTRTKGSGFAFDQNSLLYEMGIVMGTSTSFLYNNVRSINSGFDNDFRTVNKIKEILPGIRSRSEIFGRISNSTVTADQVFLLDYRSLVWGEAPYDKFVIMEYVISNPTAQPITGFHFGLFADWDITASGGEDAAKWDNARKMGYVYPAQTAAKPHAGIQLLTGTPGYFAIDNSQDIAGNPFGIYDGYTDAEKIQSISSGLARLEAGTTTPTGNDVSHVVSSGPYTIPPGQQIKIAFALHAAPNLGDLQLSAKHADSVYNFTLNAPKPVIASVNACYGTPASLTATGATTYKWYKSFTGETPFFTGAQFTTPNLFNDTTYFVSNAEESYESVRTPATAVVKANPALTLSGSTVLCSNESLTISVAPADTYLWNTGATTRTISVTTAGTFSVTVTDTGLGCSSLSSNVVTTVNPAPTSLFGVPGTPFTPFTPIAFTDQSTNAVSWLWDFGDGGTSTDKNPSHTYITFQEFDVKLTVTSDKGCKDSSTKKIQLITGLEDQGHTQFNLYPNPSSTRSWIEVDNGSMGAVRIAITNTSGQSIYEYIDASGQSRPVIELPLGELPPGLYTVIVKTDTGMAARKFVCTR